MPKKQTINTNENTTVYMQDRYLLLPAAAERIGLPVRTLRAWREKWRIDPNMAGLFAKSGKFVFFDLDAWARYLERIQLAAVEDARAWQNRFRLVLFFPAAGIGMAIVIAMIHGGGRF